MKNLLKKYKITQNLIALNLNVTQQSVSKWCNAQSEPSLNTIIKMSEAFGIPIEEIVLAFKKES